VAQLGDEVTLVMAAIRSFAGLPSTIRRSAPILGGAIAASVAILLTSDAARGFLRATTRTSSRVVTRSFLVPSVLPCVQMPSMNPPQPPPSWSHTADDIAKLTREAIARQRKLYDRVAGLSATECNFDSVSRGQSLAICHRTYLATSSRRSS
jgi:hypothetical protein